MFRITFIIILFALHVDSLHAQSSQQNSRDLRGRGRDSLIKNIYPARAKTHDIYADSTYYLQNLNYPRKAYEENIQGVVYVNTVIDYSGIPHQSKILQGIGYGCDEEALRLVNGSKFLPSVSNIGNSTNYHMVISIEFNKRKYDIMMSEINCDSLMNPVESMLHTPKIPPELVGALALLQKRLEYPKDAKEKNIEGKVYIKTLIDKNGRTVCQEIFKGIGFGCDEEAIRLVKTSEFTIPRISSNKKQPTSMMILVPVDFNIAKYDSIQTAKQLLQNR